MLNDRTHRRAARRDAGFTLIELLIAIAAMAFVLIYTLGTFTANRNTYVVIESVSEAHQNTLASASMIERDVRNAGYMVPAAAAACGVDSTGAADTLFVSDSDAIRSAANLPSALASGNLAASPTAGNVPTAWPNTVALDDLAIDQQDTYDTDATPGTDSDFRKDAGVIFTNLDNPGDGVYCGVITAVDTANDQITIDLRSPPPSSGIGNWAFVPANVYEISGGALVRNGIAMTPNVEDLQIAWFYDLNVPTPNGQMDAGEDLGSATGGPQLLADALTDPARLREIRFNLIVKTAEDDPNDPNSAGIGQARENRTANVPGQDGRRRRVHTATIRLRNLMT